MIILMIDCMIGLFLHSHEAAFHVSNYARKRGLYSSRNVEDEPRRPTSPCFWIKASCSQIPRLYSLSCTLRHLRKKVFLISVHLLLLHFVCQKPLFVTLYARPGIVFGSAYLQTAPPALGIVCFVSLYAPLDPCLL